MTKITDAEMDALTSRLENLSYNGQDSLTEMSEIYKNSLMAEQLRFMLATKELDPKPTAQEVLDEIIGTMLAGCVTMAWADGITLPNIVSSVVALWSELEKNKKSKMN